MKRYSFFYTMCGAVSLAMVFAFAPLSISAPEVSAADAAVDFTGETVTVADAVTFETEYTPEQTVAVPALYFGNESTAFTREYTYTNEYRLSDTERGIVIPLEVSAPGTLKVNIEFTRLDEPVYVYLYSDAALKNRLSIMGSASSGTLEKEGYVSVDKAGTYYLKFYTSLSFVMPYHFINSIVVSICQYTDTDKAINSGQTITYFRKAGTDPYYFKYKAKKNGIATVKLPYPGGSYLTLLNADKKPVSEEEQVTAETGSKFSFAVKKGKVYYFLVKSHGTSSNLQSISVKQNDVKEKSGKKREKAVRIKAGKNIRGLVFASEKKADWYSFKLKRKKSVTIRFSGKISGQLKIAVYDRSGKSYGSFQSDGSLMKLKPIYGEMEAGTYFIKIEKNNAVSCGLYRLRYK